MSREREFGTLQVFVWTFGTTLGLMVCFQLLEAVLPGSTRDLVTLGAVEGLIYGVACFLVWQLYASARPVPEFLGIRRTHPLLPVLGLLLGIALQAPADSLQHLVEAVVGPPGEQELLERAVMMRADTEFKAAMLMLSTACVVPLAEELLFRGAFFGGLRARMAALPAAVLTGVAFVICHMQPRVWLPLAAVAAVLGLLRVVSGSMLPGFALHLSFNAVTLALVVLRVVPVDQRLGLSWQLTFLGWVASALLIVLVLRVANTVEAEQARTEDDAA